MTNFALTILGHVRKMGVQNMYEDRNSPNCVSRLHVVLPACKESYPNGTYVGPKGRPGSCDVVFDGNWIGVKFAWTYLHNRPYCTPNKSFRPHLLTKPDESALKDVLKKLPTLIGNPAAKRIGLLLVCFHSPRCPFSDSDIDELEVNGKLRDDGWTRSDLPDWPNPRNRGCFIRAYFWERSALRRRRS
jgi:hypothetical protein